MDVTEYKPIVGNRVCLYTKTNLQLLRINNLGEFLVYNSCILSSSLSGGQTKKILFYHLQQFNHKQCCVAYSLPPHLEGLHDVA